MLIAGIPVSKSRMGPFSADEKLDDEEGSIMADEKKSFSDLLSEAPLAPNEDTVSLVGALARSSQPGKFVLATSPGNSVTLDVDAVKGYQVIGGGVGQVLVQVDVDRAQVPDSAQAAVKIGSGIGIAQSGLPDLKHPALDKYPWEEPVKIHPEAAQANSLGGIQTGIYDYKHPVFDKHPWEEPARTHPETDQGPFALVTPQQAPPSSLEAMQGAATSSLKTIFSADVGGTGYRDVYKHPWLDATGRPPYLD